MDVAVIEQPLGDRYLNDDLWTLADEQFLPVDQKRVLAANGLRAGKVSGVTPPELQTLLTSERSCPQPRSWRLRAGGTSSHDIGPILSRCRYQLVDDSPPIKVELKDALCQLEIRPSLTQDGRTGLRVVPRIQHNSQDRKLAVATPNGWLKRREKPVEAYEALNCEVCLAPNEYLIIGARRHLPESLGYAFFVRPLETPPVQRLLVVRTSRVMARLDDDTEGRVEIDKKPPLALQAVWDTAP
jgi:hypothetical protein